MFGKALLFRFESQTDEDTMDTFLENLSAEVSWEKNTLAWFGLRYMRGEFGVISYFRDEDGREAHLGGAVAAKLLTSEQKLMTGPPRISRLEILAGKMPANLQDVTKGLVLRFKARAGHEAEVVQFLKDCAAWAEEDPGTLAWFAQQYDENNFGVFGVFADNAHRFLYLTGKIPREAAKRATTIFGGVPEMNLVDVLTGNARISAPGEQAA